MPIGARPRNSLLGVLAVQLALLTTGAVLDALNVTDWHSLGRGLVIALLLSWLVYRWWRTFPKTGPGSGFVAEPADDEDHRGLWAIVIVAAALLALASTLIRLLRMHSPPGVEWNWPGTLTILVLVLVASWFAAREWTSRVFAATLVAFFVIGGAGVFVLGSLVTFDSSMSALVTSSKAEITRLSDAEKAKTASEAKAAKSAFEDARSELEESLKPAPDEIVAAAEPLVTALGELPDDPAEPRLAVVDAALLKLLRQPMATEFEAHIEWVRSAAEAAVDAIPPKAATPVDHTNVDAAVDVLDECRVDRHCDRKVLSGDVHSVRVALAQYKALLDPEDKALQEAAMKLLNTDPEQLKISPATAISAGGNAVAASLGNAHRPAVALGPVGWAVIGLCAILYFRWLLTVNNAQLPGPVKIDAFADADGKNPLRPTFEIAVLKNLAGAGSTPGSSVVGAAADLVAAADEKVGKLATAIKTAWSALVPTAGYSVSASVEVLSTPPSPPSAPSATPSPTLAPVAANPDAQTAAGATTTKPTRVLATIKTAGSGTTLKSEVFVEESEEAAARAAGLWAAAFILARSSRVPSWASWSAASAKALATSIAPDPSLEELEAASKAAPRSGLTLAKYGGALELAGRRLDAIEMYARAVTNHPRYMVARYRLAAALCMSTRGEEVEWDTASFPRRASVKAAVDTAVARLGLTASPGFRSPTTDVEYKAIRALGVAIFETIETDHGGTERWTANLRQSERSKDWLKALRPSTRVAASRMKWLAKSGRLVNAPVSDSQPLDESLLGAVETETDDPDSSFQVSYNLACYYATREGTEENVAKAVRSLERCLVRPGVESLRSAWVGTDPDLASLAPNSRFQLVLAQLATGEET